MLIKSARLSQSKSIRDHQFPSEREDNAAEEEYSEEPEEEVVSVDRCLLTIEALEEELERTKEQRYDEGFESGEKAGYTQGIETIQTQIDQFVEVLDAIRVQQEAIITSSERFVVDFALKIVEKIIGVEKFSELQIDRPKLEKIVEEALNLFADSTKYVIRVHRDTAEVLEKYKSEILDHLSRPVALSIVDDPSLRPYDCLIESEHGVLDARIDSQVKEIKSVFMSK